MSMSGSLEIRLSSTVEITGPDGKPIRIGSTKSRALVAMLATAQDMKLSRSWLRERLWCDRGRPQATASLRQELYQLRKRLGELGDALIQTRTHIALDPRLCAVHIARTDPQLLLLDLDVPGLPFQAWRDELRQSVSQPQMSERHARQAHDESGISIHIFPESNGRFAPFDQALSGLIAASLRDLFAAEVFQIEDDRKIDHCASFAIRSGDGFANVILRDAQEHTLWSHIEPMPGDLNIMQLLERPDTQAFANQCVESTTTLTRILEHHHSPAVMVAQAQYLTFSMERANLLRAETLLRQAQKIQPAGIQLAFRGLIALMLQTERTRQNSVERAERLMTQALRMDPNNALVLSLFALLRLSQGKALATTEMLVRKAIDLCPGMPFPWAVLAATLRQKEEQAQAFYLSSIAQKLSQRAPFGYWWQLQRCANAVLVAHGVLPEDRPADPVALPAAAPGYLSALFAARGNQKSARLRFGLTQPRATEQNEAAPSIPVFARHKLPG